LLLGINEDFWALGMAVMRGYYVTHDIANDKIGFVPQKDCFKSVPVYSPETTSPNSELKDPLSTLPDWAVWVISIASAVIAAVISLVLALVPGEGMSYGHKLLAGLGSAENTDLYAFIEDLTTQITDKLLNGAASSESVTLF